MNCQEIRPQITAYIDNSLESQLVSEVRRHLDSCAACAEFHREQLQLADWFSSGSIELEPPAQIWAGIEGRLAPASAFHWNFLEFFQFPSFRYALAGVAALLFLSAALLLNSGEAVSFNSALAQIESYNLNVEGNPFWPEVRSQNPFFEFDRQGLERVDNPFDRSDQLP